MLVKRPTDGLVVLATSLNRLCILHSDLYCKGLAYKAKLMVPSLNYESSIDSVQPWRILFTLSNLGNFDKHFTYVNHRLCRRLTLFLRERVSQSYIACMVNVARLVYVWNGWTCSVVFVPGIHRLHQTRWWLYNAILLRDVTLCNIGKCSSGEVAALHALLCCFVKLYVMSLAMCH